VTGLVLSAAAVIPATFTVLTAWAWAAGSPRGMLAGGLLAAIWWTAWAFLATRVLDAAPKRGKR
jgi:hypothetical protein